jgi:hypothetical protein
VFPLSCSFPFFEYLSSSTDSTMHVFLDIYTHVSLTTYVQAFIHIYLLGLLDTRVGSCST